MEFHNKKSITSYINILENRLLRDDEKLWQRFKDMIVAPEAVKETLRVCKDFDRYQLRAAKLLLEMKSCNQQFPKDERGLPEWVKPAVEDKGDYLFLYWQKFAECIESAKISGMK